MVVRQEAKAQGTLAENDDIDVVRVVINAILILDDVEGTERGKIVRREDLNLLTGLLGGDVFDGQRMHAKGFAQSPHLFLGWPVDIQPPHSVGLAAGKRKEATYVLTRKHEIPKLSCMNGGFPRGGKEAEAVGVKMGLLTTKY